MKKILLLALFFCLPAYSAVVGGTGTDWETGALTGWTVGGGSTNTVKSTGWSDSGIGVAVSGGLTNYSPGGGKTWTVNPYGTYMGTLQAGSGSVSFDSAVTSLGLSSGENSAIKSYLSFQSSNGGGGNPTPTNATWIKKTVALTAGTTYTIAWNYLSTDYAPFNDGSMMTLTHSSDASKIPTLNNSQQRYALLGFTNPGTGNYATNSYGSTGWQLAVFTVPESGNYDLGFASFNLGDTALSPILFVDQVQGSTTLNGAAFGPIAPNAGSTAPSTPTTPPPAAPNWQTIKTTSSPVVISNIYPTSNNSPSNEGAANAFDGNASTKYLNFDKQNAGVTVKLSQGRVVQKFTLTTANDAVERDPASYKLYGSNDGVTWTLLSEGPLSLSDSRFAVSGEIAVANTNAYIYYFIKFPSIKNDSGNSVQISEVTYYYDLDDGVTSTDTGTGGTPANPGQAGSVCADCAPTWPATSDISLAQTAQKNAAKSRVANIVLGNHLYLEQKIGSSGNAVTIEQTGNYNKIAGLGGGTYSVIDGDNNAVNIKQGDTIGKNLIEFSVTGNSNNVTIWQARDVTNGVQDASESGGHYAGLDINGNSNTVSIKQGNQGGSNSGHFGLMYITGNNNNMSLKQGMNGEKTAFVTVNGSNNTGSITQWGGEHYTDLAFTGNGHTANVTQQGVTTHKATINLTNAGGASNITLLQQGTTAQNINITQQCATLSGCSVSVTQGGAP
jgi:hypothetical protein